MTDYNYGFDALRGIPQKMKPWRLHLQQPWPSEFGEYVLIDVAPADIEQHHQVEVVDENGKPLRGVGVMFGYPGGNGQSGPEPNETYWRGHPTVVNGNYQVTNYAGYAQHTFQSGGEDIFIWNIDDDGVLKLPSVIVANCTWVNAAIARFEHTGVKLRFQRRMVGVVPEADRLDKLEADIASIKEQLRLLTESLD